MSKWILFLFLFAVLFGMQLGCQRRPAQDVYQTSKVPVGIHAQEDSLSTPVPNSNLQFFPKR